MQAILKGGESGMNILNYLPSFELLSDKRIMRCLKDLS